MRTPVRLLTLVALALGGCGGVSAPVAIELVVAASGGACTEAQATAPMSTLSATFLRVSVIERALGTASLQCDRRVEMAESTGNATLSLETDTTTRLDLLVEAYDSSEPPQLVASGVAIGINRRPRLAPLQILLVPVGGFACAPGLLGSGRALHSATLLPNGQVLVVGGVTTVGGGQLAANDTIEVYDPRLGTFTAVGGDVLPGSALHTATVLAAPGPLGPYDLLMVGGIRAKATTGPMIAIGGATDALPLMPTAAAGPTPSFVLRYYPWADPPEVRVMAGSPQLEGRMLQAAGVAGSRLIVAGGLSDATGGQLASINDFEILPARDLSMHDGPFALARPRIGAVAGALSENALIIYGGNLLSADDAMVAADAAEVVTLGETVTSEVAAFEAGSATLVGPVAHATLTPIADGLLVAGGLAVRPGSARAVRETRPVVRLSQVEEAVRVVEVGGDPFTPVAYHAAVPLAGGDALLLGGASTTCAGGGLCATAAVYRYGATTGTLARGASPMLTARFGHAVTLLDDGTVLVTGGLTSQGTAPIAPSSAELYVPPPSAGQDQFGRAPGEVSGPGCP